VYKIAHGDDNDSLQIKRALRHAAHFLAEAEDMLVKGAPFADPAVQRMITCGRLELGKVPI